MMARSTNSRYALMVPLLFVAAALAGCAGGGSGALSPDAVQIEITDYSESASPGAEIYVTWQLTITAMDNGTDENSSFDETGLVYTSDANASGESPDDFENSTGQQENAGEGTYNATFVVDEPGTIYATAYVTAAGQTKFSSPVAIEVGEGGGENNTVSMTDAPAGFLSAYDPQTITIEVGESVVWHNEDDDTHTATADDGSFDTGDVAAGEYSETVIFDEEGEFTYSCNYHPTMTGTVIVEGGGNNTTAV